MNNLLRDLESLQISGNLSDQTLWQKCTELIQKTLVPQRTLGNERPCEEKDFREFRQIVDRNLRHVKCMLQLIIKMRNEESVQIDYDSNVVKEFVVSLAVMIGEQHERNLWNTAESVSISKELTVDICNLYGIESLSQFFMVGNHLSLVLLTLRPKLLKDTWKTYPAAVSCYKWVFKEAETSVLYDHISDVLPTALIIIEDYVPENVVIGLECLYQIIQYSHLKIHCSHIQKKGLIDTGYADVIYHSLQCLVHQREARYIVPLYLCLTSLLAIMEYWDTSLNVFEWTRRDDVLGILLDNMELEQNLELRHAYMLSLAPLLTNIGCAKWCERLTRILSEYCEHHTDLRTLKATLETAKAFLLLFHLRVAAHCVPLYTAFLKLHFDLTETPVFDKEIVQNLEDCICLLYKLSPNVGCAIMRDDRMRLMIKNSLQVDCLGDPKYFE